MIGPFCFLAKDQLSDPLRLCFLMLNLDFEQKNISTPYSNILNRQTAQHNNLNSLRTHHYES